MCATGKNILLTGLFILILSSIRGQVLDFNGQAAAWTTVNNSAGTGFQAGIRYIPQLLLTRPMGEKYKIDGELSADSHLSFTRIPDTSDIFVSKASLYRFWLRFSGERFEIRAGLQKINFGSASMLRPLMWFDRIDPRDPLRLTRGVYGLQGKYFFNNNASIWLWALYGNENTKGWELVPSKKNRPELGGRIQLPVPRGEVAFSYHNRKAEFPADRVPAISGSRDFPENRFGFDFKIDLGIGLWLETSVTHQEQHELPPFSKALSFGADYTLGIGNGLNIMAEHLLFNYSEDLFSKGEGISFTGLSAGVPLTVISRLGAIVFYDWKNKGFYRFANLSFTFDNLVLNVIGFWNPDTFRIFNYDSGPNLFSGAGGQLMVVYNY